MSKLVGYAPGVYDLFHIGHLNILRHARSQCDHLIAGVVSDEMCRRAKGRPPVIPLASGSRSCATSRSSTRCTLETVPDKLDTWESAFDRIFKGDDWRGTAQGRQARGGLRAPRRRGRLLPLHRTHVEHGAAPSAHRTLGDARLLTGVRTDARRAGGSSMSLGEGVEDLQQALPVALGREGGEGDGARTLQSVSASSSSSKSRSTASARASASLGGTSSPVSSCRTVSRCPWTAVATTGRAASCASTTALPNDSPRDGAMTTAARSRTGHWARCSPAARPGPEGRAPPLAARARRRSPHRRAPRCRRARAPRRDRG